VLETFSPPAVTFSSAINAHKAPEISFGVQDLPGCWAAATADQNQWLAMDTGSVRSIVGVATQGRGDHWAIDNGGQWVTSYKVSVSNDASSWTPVDAGITFPGNVGIGDPVVRNDFAAVVSARYVRIEPVTWFSPYIVMRAGVYFEKCP